MSEEGGGGGCVSVIVFFAVWIGCMIAAGPLGFMLGWLPALVLAFIWPRVLALGVFGIILIIVVIAIIAVFTSADR